MEAGVATLAGPVSVAGFAKWYVAVGVILAQRMLLTASYVLRPVTSVSFFVIEETADAKLLSGCAVPASPVSGAGGFMSKDAIKPVAMVCADGGIVAFTTVAVSPMGVVAHFDEPLPAVACIDEAVGAGAQNGLVIGAASVELVVMVAVFLMRQSPCPRLAVSLIEVVKRVAGQSAPRAAGLGGSDGHDGGGRLLCGIVLIVVVAKIGPLLKVGLRLLSTVINTLSKDTRGP